MILLAIGNSFLKTFLTISIDSEESCVADKKALFSKMFCISRLRTSGLFPHSPSLSTPKFFRYTIGTSMLQGVS